jgi:hypothetical protein
LSVYSSQFRRRVWYRGNGEGLRSSKVKEFKGKRKKKLNAESTEGSAQSSQRRGTQEHSSFEAQGKQEWLCHESGHGEFRGGRVKE